MEVRRLSHLEESAPYIRAILKSFEASSPRRPDMMQGFDGMGMGWGMGLFGLLILILVVLAIAALIKYLRT